uniref:Reverse transcriptase domain-containing protein n=1 Tax=Tanacetum cinerariifolium TaxID=118510 RepID=A0A6L2K0Y1_TANCI|nr:hypothetical protein [Tanacetum cinerariifolium]
MTELTLEESLSMFLAKIAKRLDENTNLIKELRASTDFALRNQKASIKALEIQPIRRIEPTKQKLIFRVKKTTLPSSNHLNDDYWDELKETDGEKDPKAYHTDAKPLGKALPRKEKDLESFTLPCFINNMCFSKALADLGASVSVMPYSTYLKLGLGDLIPTKLIVELVDRTVKRSKGISKNVPVGIDKFTFLVDFIILHIPEDFKTTLILGRPFLSTAHAIINVFKAKITLSVGNDKIFFKSNKLTSNIIKRVYALSLIKSTKHNLEARIMGNVLRKNRSHDPKFKDFLELKDLNEPLELRHDQVVDLGPIIEESEVLDAPMDDLVNSENDELDTRISYYLSCCDYDKKIRSDCAHNLKFSWMIGFGFIHANFLPNLPINVMSKKFYNSIMKDKIKFKGTNELGNRANIPIFIGNFCVPTGFTVVEDMNPYVDEGLREVVDGKPFCEVSCVEIKRFDGMITIHSDDESVT